VAGTVFGSWVVCVVAAEFFEKDVAARRVEAVPFFGRWGEVGAESSLCWLVGWIVKIVRRCPRWS
jgi:hypothetical protein